MSLIELQKSYDYGEAHIIKSLLLSHDIYCEIYDNNAATSLAFYQFAIGGTRIMVHEEDYAKAKDLIKETLNKNKTEKRPPRPFKNQRLRALFSIWFSAGMSLLPIWLIGRDKNDKD